MKPMHLHCFRFVLLVFLLFTVSSCIRVIRPGQVGLKQRNGKLKEKVYTQGIRFINPFTTRILKVSTQTQNMKYSMDLPTKEGLTVETVVSLLFHVRPDAAQDLYQQVGPNYEEKIIRTIFRSAARDVSARFLAKDLHTAGRAEIEKAIESSISDRLLSRGIVVEAVLLKSITLPPTLRQAIEAKLSAEQDAQRMEFVIQKEKQEAKRKRIEAEGIADYQETIQKALNDTILKYNTIEAFRELSKSPNAKVIITNGKQPMLIED